MPTGLRKMPRRDNGVYAGDTAGALQSPNLLRVPAPGDQPSAYESFQIVN